MDDLLTQVANTDNQSLSHIGPLFRCNDYTLAVTVEAVCNYVNTNLITFSLAPC